ncbi:MAG: hypothetical protein MAG431_00736 [Chloroflexi bacterium]|nr:hypothetical protein [Chloroflexota bacterium]
MTVKTNHQREKRTNVIRWIARIWGAFVFIVAVFIIMAYAGNWMRTGVADPYAVEDYPPIENLPPIFMFLSALGLGIAWRWEGWGGGVALLFQLATLPVLLIHWPLWEDFPRFLIAPYGVWLIVIIPSILFLVCWQRSR